MNGIVNVNAYGGALNMPIPASASRGILALQGTGVSFAGAFEATGTAHVACAQEPNRVLRQDKPSGSWRPAAIEAAGVFAFAGYEQAFDLPVDTGEVVVSDETDMPAARLRTAHQATVIRNRHRCRSR